jgi:hypothetical protein
MSSQVAERMILKALLFGVVFLSACVFVDLFAYTFEGGWEKLVDAALVTVGIVVLGVERSLIKRQR